MSNYYYREQKAKELFCRYLDRRAVVSSSCRSIARVLFPQATFNFTIIFSCFFLTTAFLDGFYNFNQSFKRFKRFLSIDSSYRNPWLDERKVQNASGVEWERKTFQWSEFFLCFYWIFIWKVFDSVEHKTWKMFTYDLEKRNKTHSCSFGSFVRESAKNVLF